MPKVTQGRQVSNKSAILPEIRAKQNMSESVIIVNGNPNNTRELNVYNVPAEWGRGSIEWSNQ